MNDELQLMPLKDVGATMSSKKIHDSQLGDVDKELIKNSLFLNKAEDRNTTEHQPSQMVDSAAKNHGASMDTRDDDEPNSDNNNSTCRNTDGSGENPNETDEEEWFSPRKLILEAKSSEEELKMPTKKVASRRKCFEGTVSKKTSADGNAMHYSEGMIGKASRASIGGTKGDAKDGVNKKLSRQSLPAKLLPSQNSDSIDTVRDASMDRTPSFEQSSNLPPSPIAISNEFTTTTKKQQTLSPKPTGTSRADRIAQTRLPNSTPIITSSSKTEDTALARARAKIEGRKKSRETAKARAIAVMDEISLSSPKNGRGESHSRSSDSFSDNRADSGGDRLKGGSSSTAATLAELRDKRFASARSKEAKRDEQEVETNATGFHHGVFNGEENTEGKHNLTEDADENKTGDINIAKSSIATDGEIVPNVVERVELKSETGNLSQGEKEDIEHCSKEDSTFNAYMAANQSSIDNLFGTTKHATQHECGKSKIPESASHVGVNSDVVKTSKNEHEEQNDYDGVSSNKNIGFALDRALTNAGNEKLALSPVGGTSHKENKISFYNVPGHNIPQTTELPSHNQPLPRRQNLVAHERLGTDLLNTELSSCSAESVSEVVQSAGSIGTTGKLDKMLYQRDINKIAVSKENKDEQPQQERSFDDDESFTSSYLYNISESLSSSENSLGGPLWQKAAEEAASSAYKNDISPAPSISVKSNASRKWNGSKMNAIIAPGEPKSLYNKYREENGSAVMEMEVTTEDEIGLKEWTGFNYTRLTHTGIVGILGGFFPSLFVQTTCHFVTGYTDVGDEGVEFDLHYGLWKYTPVDSAFQGYSYCSNYDDQYITSSPVVPRIAGLAGLLFGTLPLITIWTYISFSVVSDACWTSSMWMLLLGCMCQAGTFLIFLLRSCRDNECGMGPGAWASVISTLAWLILAIEMKLNSPLCAHIPKTGPGVVLIEKKQSYARAIKREVDQLFHKLNGTRSREWENVPSLSKCAMKKQAERIDVVWEGAEEDTGMAHTRHSSYSPPNEIV